MAEVDLWLRIYGLHMIVPLRIMNRGKHFESNFHEFIAAR